MTNKEDLHPENRAATRCCQEAIKLEDLSRDPLHNAVQHNSLTHTFRCSLTADNKQRYSGWAIWSEPGDGGATRVEAGSKGHDSQLLVFASSSEDH